MIAKILDKTGSFNAVNYNTKKINNGAGELMAIQNMPTLSMNNIPNPQIVKDYLKAYSNTNKRVYIIIEKGSSFYLKSIPFRKDFQRT